MRTTEQVLVFLAWLALTVTVLASMAAYSRRVERNMAPEELEERRYH